MDSLKLGMFAFCHGEWKLSDAIFSVSKLRGSASLFSLQPHSLPCHALMHSLIPTQHSAFALPAPLAWNALPLAAHLDPIYLLPKQAAQVGYKVWPDSSRPNESALLKTFSYLCCKVEPLSTHMRIIWGVYFMSSCLFN